MDHYAELDAKLVNSIRKGISNFNRLSARHAADAEPFTTEDREAWRVIDMRLQALRQAGKILYSRRSGWTVAIAATAGAPPP